MGFLSWNRTNWKTNLALWYTWHLSMTNALSSTQTTERKAIPQRVIPGERCSSSAQEDPLRSRTPSLRTAKSVSAQKLPQLPCLVAHVKKTWELALVGFHQCQCPQRVVNECLWVRIAFLYITWAQPRLLTEILRFKSKLKNLFQLMNSPKQALGLSVKAWPQSIIASAGNSHLLLKASV